LIQDSIKSREPDKFSEREMTGHKTKVKKHGGRELNMVAVNLV